MTRETLAIAKAMIELEKLFQVYIPALSFCSFRIRVLTALLFKLTFIQVARAVSSESLGIYIAVNRSHPARPITGMLSECSSGEKEYYWNHDCVVPMSLSQARVHAPQLLLLTLSTCRPKYNPDVAPVPSYFPF